VGSLLNRANLQDDFFARLGDREPCCVGGLINARLALGRGDFPTALRHFNGVKLNPQNRFHWFIDLDGLILRRAVEGKDPDWAALAAEADGTSASPGQRLFLAWYTGKSTWEEVAARMPTVDEGEELLWFRSLHEVTLGNYDVARTLLPPMIEHHPDWIESADAGALLTWLAKQTPERLAALPKAKPLPAGKRGAVGAVNDF
jgi:hypothetical protein